MTRSSWTGSSASSPSSGQHTLHTHAQYIHSDTRTKGTLSSSDTGILYSTVICSDIVEERIDDLFLLIF